MSQGDILNIVNQTVFQIILISAPLLGVAMVVGLIISIFQATTSIQEQTLTFVPKMIVIMLLLVFMGPFFVNQMLDFTRHMFDLIGRAKM